VRRTFVVLVWFHITLTTFCARITTICLYLPKLYLKHYWFHFFQTRCSSSKYGISVLLSNILTFKLLLNGIERKERKKSKRTKVSTKFRRGTNPPKSYINNKSRTFHNITARSQRQVPFVQCQGIGPGRTWCSAATDLQQPRV